MKACSTHWSADARPIGMGAGGRPPQRGQITVLRAFGGREGGRMGNLLFWLGIGGSAERRWVEAH